MLSLFLSLFFCFYLLSFDLLSMNLFSMNLFYQIYFLCRSVRRQFGGFSRLFKKLLHKLVDDIHQAVNVILSVFHAFKFRHFCHAFIDKEHADEQVMDIVEHISEYQDLVDKNRETALKMAPWEIRMKQIMEWLEGLGYEK